MSEQNAAFEKLYGEIPHDIQSKLNYQEAQSHFNVGYRAATAEANKRIEALEGEVAKFGERKQLYKDKWIVYKPLDAQYAGIRTEDGVTIAGTSSGLSEKDAQEICANRVDADSLYAMVGMLANERKKSTQLQANNHDLREALNQLSALKLSSAPHIQKLEAADKIVTKALKIKPAESLQAHDNEVIEKCAKVCDGYIKATFFAHNIRALKEVK